MLSTVARLVILFGPESHCRGSGSLVSGGGSEDSRAEAARVHTPSKNPLPVSSSYYSLPEGPVL